MFLSFEEKALALGKDLVLAIEASSGIEALENISMSSQVSRGMVQVSTHTYTLCASFAASSYSSPFAIAFGSGF